MNTSFDEKFTSFANFNGDSMKNIEALLGITRQSLYDKRTQRFPFKISEIQLMMVHWGMTPEQVYDLFLTEGLDEIIEQYNENEDVVKNRLA